MGEHDCIQEGEIGEIRSTVHRMEKELFGNGKDGLIQTIPRLSVQVESLKTSSDNLRIAVSGLNKFMDETKGSQNTLKNAVPWISVMVAILALAFTIVTTSGVKREKEYVRTQLQYKQDRPPDPQTRSLTPEQVKEIKKK